MKRIWIVGEDPLILAGMRIGFLRIGLESQLFSDPFQFLKMVSTGRSPDLLMLDHKMAGLETMDVLKMLRGIPRFRGIPIFIVTHEEPSQIEGPLLNCGANAVLRRETPFRKVSEAVLSAVSNITASADPSKKSDPNLAMQG